jgi:hypothetical protein
VSLLLDSPDISQGLESVDKGIYRISINKILTLTPKIELVLFRDMSQLLTNCTDQHVLVKMNREGYEF